MFFLFDSHFDSLPVILLVGLLVLLTVVVLLGINNQLACDPGCSTKG